MNWPKPLPARPKIAKVNVDEEEALALKFNVMAIPSLIFFNQGQVVERIEGVSDKDNLTNKLNGLMGLGGGGGDRRNDELNLVQVQT